MNIKRVGTIVTAIALICLQAAGAWASIPLTEVRVVGSPPVLHFPITCRMDSISIVRGSMTISTRGNSSSWPAVSIDSGPPVQSATLWVLEQIDGVWYGAGAERLRPNQVNGSKPEAEDDGAVGRLIGNGWLYDPNRWGPMGNYNPPAGAHIGFVVVAGSTRSDSQTPVQERCDVVEVIWPAGNGSNPLPIVWREADGQQQTQPSQPPVTSQPTVPNSPAGAITTTDLTPVLNALLPMRSTLEDINRQLGDLEAKQQAAYKDLTAQHEAQKANTGGGNPLAFFGSAEFWKYAGSALAGLITALTVK